MSDREKILDKVAKLLAKAASTSFGPEALLYQQKADELMLEWAVEEFELSRRDPRNMAYQPELRKFKFATEISHNGVWQYVFRIMADFCRCKVAVNNYSEATLVGYPGDLDYLEALQVTIQLHIVKTIFPKPDPTESEAANMYRLRMAGNNWDQCHQIMHNGEHSTKSQRVRYTKIVGDYAKQHGLPRNMTASQEGYRQQFVSAFAYRLRDRFAEIMQTQDEEHKYALVLRDRASDLDEFLWTQFPNLRPHPSDCDCDTCHSCKDPSCKRCAWKYDTRPVRTRYAKTTTHAYNPAANEAGRRAANAADLGQTRVGSAQKKEVN